MPSASRLFHNWRLKLSALGLALFLWAVVQAEPSNRETFSAVPVEVEISDTSWALAGPAQPPTVEIRLGGIAREIIRLAREGTTLRVTVTRVGSRDSVITVRSEWVAAAQRPGVTVESITPSTVSLSFEPAMTRLVPVAPRVQGELPGGLALVGDVSPNPQFVRIRGPESRVAGLDSAALEMLDLGAVSQSGVFTVAVDTAGLAGGTVAPSTVSLGIRVEQVVERVLPGVVVRVDAGEGEPALVAEPRAIEVRIAGGRSLVTGLDVAAIEARVDPEALRGMAPGEVRRVPVEVSGVPDDVRADALVDGVEVRRAADLGLSPPGDASW